MVVVAVDQRDPDALVRRRAKATHVLDRMVRTAMRLELAAALATVVLFGGALIALVTGRANEGAAAAAVAGTITGLGAIRGCGYAFGTIITAAPQAAVYRRFVRSAPAQQGQTVVPVVHSVALDNVSFGYPDAPGPALRDVSMRLGAVNWSRSSG